MPLTTFLSHFNLSSTWPYCPFLVSQIKSSCRIVENINNWIEAKNEVDMKKQGGSKKGKLKGLAKLEDANLAGGKYVGFG